MNPAPQINVPPLPAPARELLAIVREELSRLAPVGAHAHGHAIGEQSLLIEDVGLDSLRFVDLTVALEDALQIAEFPMQDWVDAQVAADLPLTVGALVLECERLVAATGRRWP